MSLAEIPAQNDSAYQFFRNLFKPFRARKAAVWGER